jgi:hypothetical protein
MRVKETVQKNGRTNVAIIEKYWDSATKMSRQRTVKGLGYLDVLDKEHGDGRAWARALCDKLNAEKAAAEAGVGLVIHPMERIDGRRDFIKNIGCAIALCYYNALGIERCLRNHARGRDFAYDANAVMRLLVCERMVAPSSKLSAWMRRGHYFFRSEFSDDDVYRALDFFASAKDAVISATNRAIAKMHTRNLTDAYYDVTNYYFEIDEQDVLRKNGVSKEHRRKPIVQMGLMQDKDGIPITFNIHPGNTHDSDTMLPAMAQAKRDVGAKRMVMVADKGLNTSTNIAAIILDGNGFVFSQSIRGRKSPAELREWVLADTGWRAKPDCEGGTDFKIKSRQGTKTVHIEDENGKRVDVDIEVKTVAFWSSKYDKRAKYERSKVLEKARALVKDPSSYDRAIHYGAARYVKNVTFDKKTGEVLEHAGKKPCIDDDYIAEQERSDGYYVIVTSELGLTDDRIIEVYRGLWRIEEAFKVTKSYLSARPVFVWTPEHILAHFLICYIALVIVRCIQYDTGYAIGAAAVIDEIRDMCGVRLEDSWWHFYHRTDISDELCRIAGIDLTRRYMRLEDVKKVLAKVKGK